jgi:hypothetical protein
MPSGVLAPIPLQWFDDAGAVLAGGSLTWYAAGTTNPISTWSAIAMGSGNLNANPVVLSSAGRPSSGPIFVLRGQGYRVVAKDASGAQVLVLDNVLVYDDPTPAAAVVEWPIGAGGEWFGSGVPSARFAFQIGTTYEKADYATLYGVLGDRFAKGTETATQFSIPDKRQRYGMGQAGAAVSTPADPTLATNQSGTDLAAGNYKVAIVGVSATGAVSLPSSSVTQAVGAGGAGRIVVTYTLPTGASKVRVYVTTLAGATCDRYFEATASPFNFNTLTGAVVGALPTVATVTGAVLGATFGSIDHNHLGPAHTHGMTGSTYSEPTTISGATAAGGTEAVTGTTASGTASLSATTVSNLTAAGAVDADKDATDSGHTHAATGLSGPSHTHNAGTLAGGTHVHGAGTLSATAEGVRESAAGNVPTLVCNYIIRLY